MNIALKAIFILAFPFYAALTARMHAIKPRDETEVQWHNKIDDFWKRSPLFSNGK